MQDPVQTALEMARELEAYLFSLRKSHPETERALELVRECQEALKS